MLILVMKNAAQLTSTAAALGYMTAGRAIVTLVSEKTGTRFTYRVVRCEGHDEDESRPWFVSVLTGSDNTGSYTYLGTLFPRDGHPVFRHGKKSPIGQDAPSARAFAFVWSRLTQANRIPEQVQIWHEGRCGRCARALTVPESIASGIGPICAAKSAA